MMGNLKVKTTPLRQSRPAVEGSISCCLFLVTGFNRLNQFNFITYVSTWQAFIDQPVFSLIVCYNKRNLEGSLSELIFLALRSASHRISKIVAPLSFHFLPCNISSWLRKQSNQCKSLPFQPASLSFINNRSKISLFYYPLKIEREKSKYSLFRFDFECYFHSNPKIFQSQERYIHGISLTGTYL